MYIVPTAPGRPWRALGGRAAVALPGCGGCTGCGRADAARGSRKGCALIGARCLADRETPTHPSGQLDSLCRPCPCHVRGARSERPWLCVRNGSTRAAGAPHALSRCAGLAPRRQPPPPNTPGDHWAPLQPGRAARRYLRARGAARAEPRRSVPGLRPGCKRFRCRYALIPLN
jgi:hypothetical protein